MNLKNLGKSWNPVLKEEFQTPSTKNLLKFIEDQRKEHLVYPPANEVFSAFSQTPFEKVKVVIIGQDPYHGEDQAHGLSFSVKPGIKIPPSLRNIYKELQADLKIPPAQHGNLNSWAEQGVLLLNSVLTVRESEAASHQKKGWEEFTDKVVDILNEEKSQLVFLLWGNYAKKKGKNIDREKHLVLESGHPSPLSVRFFLGNKHFSQTNIYLKKKGLTPINWTLPEQVH